MTRTKMVLLALALLAVLALSGCHSGGLGYTGYYYNSHPYWGGYHGMYGPPRYIGIPDPGPYAPGYPVAMPLPMGLY